METNTEQQTPSSEQRETKPSGTEQLSPPSGDKGLTSEKEQAKTESSTTTTAIDFDSPAVKKWAETLTFPLRQSIDEVKSTNAKLRTELKGYQDKEAEAKLEAEEKAEAEEWEAQGHSQAEIRDFQEARKKARKEYASYDKEKTDFEQNRLSHEAKAALYDALYEALPQEKVDYLIKESEGHPKAMRLLAKEIAAELKKAKENPPPAAKPEEPTKSPKRPDPSGHSAPGGLDINSLSPKELGNMAYSKKK